MNSFDFFDHKLGGAGRIVQCDETMLNYKCKSDRGRSSINKTDALCLVEYDGKITREMTVVIPDKQSSTILPIICEKVVNGSTIWFDEHITYNFFIEKWVYSQHSLS